MNADEVETWDDWTRPAPRWPVVVLVLAPIAEVLVVAWFIARAVSGA